MKAGDLFNLAAAAVGSRVVLTWMTHCYACHGWCRYEIRVVTDPDFIEAGPERVVFCQRCRYISRVTEAA